MSEVFLKFWRCGWRLVPLLLSFHLYALEQTSGVTLTLKERREEARQIIEDHYFSSDLSAPLEEAHALLIKNIEDSKAEKEDFLLLAWAYFVRNDSLGIERTEEDIGEALNILSRGKIKLGPSPRFVFYSFYYSLFSKDRHRKELWMQEMANILKEKKKEHPFTQEEMALYFLALGTPSEAKKHFMSYINGANLSARDKAHFFDLYGNLLLFLADATLARECVETYERAITERPEVALYYAKASSCAQRGIDFDRAHLFMKNAYSLRKENPHYRTAFAASLMVQLVMKKDIWEGPKQLEVVREAYDLAPTKENFLALFAVTREHESDQKQEEVLQMGEQYFQDQLYSFYLYLYKNLKSENNDEKEKSNLKHVMLEKIIDHAPASKHKIFYSYLAFLESLEFKKVLTYSRSLYAKTYQMAKASYIQEENDSLVSSILSSLYLFQFLQTENFQKLLLAQEVIKNASLEEENKVREQTLELLRQINEKTSFKNPDLFFKFKEFVAPILRSAIGLNIFDFSVQRQMYASLHHRSTLAEVQFAEDVLNGIKIAKRRAKNEESKEIDGEQISDGDIGEESNRESVDQVKKMREYLKAQKKQLDERREMREAMEQIFSNLKSKQYDKAIAGYEKFLENPQLKDFALKSLGDLHHQLGDELKNKDHYEKSLTRLNEYLDLQPEDEAMNGLRIHVIADHLKKSEAHEQLLRSTYQKFPSNRYAASAWEKLLYKKGMGSFDEYEKVAKKIITEKFPASVKARANFHLGSAHFTKQDYVSAIKFYQSCRNLKDRTYLKTCTNAIKYTCQKAPDKNKLASYCRS